MCTAVYIGRDVAAEGHTIIARSCDLSSDKNTITTIRCYPRIENKPGRKINSIQSKASYDYPPTTHKCLCSPIIPKTEYGTLSTIGLNENGLCITATITSYCCPEILEIDPLSDKGICEETLPEYIGKSCKNPIEAIDWIEKTMAEIGNSEAMSFVVADQQEAWFIELYSGHQWAAIKLPPDKVSVYGNLFMIQTEYELDNPQAFRHSKDLFDLPKKAGLEVVENGKINLAETYNGKHRLADYSNLRTYFGHYYLNKDTVGEYETTNRYPLFFDPKQKVSLKDVFELYRYRYEGTPWDPEITKSETTRLIGTEAQFNVHAIQILEDAKPELSSIAWVSIANCEHSIFLPYSNLLTKVDERIDCFDEITKKVQSGDFTNDQEGNPILYDENIAQVLFKRLCLIAEHDRKIYGTGVRNYWSKKEELLIEEFPKVLKKASQLADKNLEDAIDYVNNYTLKLQNETIAEAKSIFDELLWYINGHIETLIYAFSFSEFKTKDEAQPRPPFNPTLCFKEKYLN